MLVGLRRSLPGHDRKVLTKIFVIVNEDFRHQEH
jgi:hypothetical protein